MNVAVVGGVGGVATLAIVAGFYFVFSGGSKTPEKTAVAVANSPDTPATPSAEVTPPPAEAAPTPPAETAPPTPTPAMPEVAAIVTTPTPVAEAPPAIAPTFPAATAPTDTSVATAAAVAPTVNPIAPSSSSPPGALPSLMAPTSNATPLQYRWENGRKYVYDVRIVFDDATLSEEVTGTITYTPRAAGFSIPGIASNTPVETQISSSVLLSKRRMYKNSTTARTYDSRVPISDNVVFTLDSLGGTKNPTGGTQLRQFLGNASLLPIEPLSNAGAAAWEMPKSSVVSIEVTGMTPTAPTMPPGMPYQPPGVGFTPPTFTPPQYAPPQVQLQANVLTAIGKAEYQITQTSGPLVIIAKKLKLQNNDGSQGLGTIDVTGTGTIKFDASQGVLQEVAFSGESLRTLNGAGIRVAVQYLIKLTDAAASGPGPAVAAIPSTPAATPISIPATPVGIGAAPPVVAVAPPAAGGIAAQNPSNDTSAQSNEVTKYLDDLKDSRRESTGMSGLSNMEPLESRRAEVLAALEPFYGSVDRYRRHRAIEVLARWADKSSAPLLIQIVEDEEDTYWLNYREAVEALQRIKDTKSIPRIVKASVRHRYNSELIVCLKKLDKTIVEKEVLVLFRSNNKDIREHACELIRKLELRSANTIQVLRRALNDSDYSIRSEAKEALIALGAKVD